MKTPKFRLSFQTSQVTDLEPSLLLGKIAAKLEDKKYVIREVTTNMVRFSWDPWKLVWNFQAPYILDGGNFEITNSETGTIVVLNYFVNGLYPLLIITTMLTFMTVHGDYWGISFFGLFFLVAATFQYFTTKNVGKDLLRDILREE
jgi:hypothetical protein